MRKLSTKRFHFIWAIFLLSLSISAFSFAQVVIRDTIDIGPKQLLNPQNTSSVDLVIEIPWLGGLPTGVHLEVLDPDLPPVYVPVRSLVFLFRHWQAEGGRMSPVPVVCS